jgi:hypothetical protein
LQIIMTPFSWRPGAASIESFENFDIEFSAYERDGENERVRVRVLDSPVEGQMPDTYESVEIPHTLRELARKLETRDLGFTGIAQLGAELAKVLLPGSVRDLYEKSLSSLKPSQGLRIRLKMGSWALATLPWEYTYVHPRGVPEKESVSLGFLVLNRRLSLVRYEIVPGSRQSLDPIHENQLRLVAVTAQPLGSAGLELDNETASVSRAVGKIRDIHLDTLANATWDEFQSKLHEPAHIVHFAGHGQFDQQMGEDFGSTVGQGSLLFETENGEADAKPAQDVALILNNTGVRLVFLSACEGGKVDGIHAWSGIATALARSGVPAVVAMQFRVRDVEALAFSRRFYENLAAGGSVDSAVTAGRLAMFDSKNEYSRDWGAAVLYLNAKEGKLFSRPAGTVTKPVFTRRFALNAVLGLCLFLLGMVYFLLHLEPLLSGIYLLGGASLAVVLSIFLLALDRFLGTVIVESVLGWFRAKAATAWLAGSCALLLGLNFFTNSIFLVRGHDSTSFRVSAVAPGLPLDTSWVIDNGTEGEIFHFYNWGFKNVTFSLGEGTCFDDAEKSLYPSASLRLRVPDDFRQTITLLRLIPGKTLWSRFESSEDINLRIIVNGQPRFTRSDPKRRVLVFGNTDIKMTCALNERADRLEKRLSDYLKTINIPEGSQKRWTRAWSNPSLENGLRLQSQDQLRVEVYENQSLIFEKDLSAATCDDSACDVFMEVH